MRILAPLLALLIGGCSPLHGFNALVPKDGGADRVASGIPFREGLRGRLDVYAPRRAVGDRIPVIVFFYGGSWNSGDRTGYAFVGRALASRGFMVIIPDYRLVPEAHYPDFLVDGAAALRWVRANAARFGGDPDRIVLAGHSAGAYNAAMLAVDERWLGADRRAIRGFAGLAGPYAFLPLDTPATRAAFGRAPDLPSTQPIAHAGPGDPPALLMVAGKDNLVRPSNAARLADALRRAGVAVEVNTYPEVGHVGILTALSRLFRGKAPVLHDLADFAGRVTTRYDSEQRVRTARSSPRL
jgi:acetyl esterase/lipase